MPKCRFCGENITKFDKEMCPYCGGKRPLDGVENFTVDITQTINTIDKEKVQKFKQHSKVVNAILCMFLGIFGADSYYLGFAKYGIVRFLINIIYIVGLFSLLYFLPIGLGLLYSILISLGSNFIVYFIIGFISLFINGKKDSNGVYLR